MNIKPRIVTKLDLIEHGFSKYLVNQITNRIKASTTKSGLKIYTASDVVLSIENKLSQPRLQSKTREALQKALAWLEGNSNVIKVDFLKNLTLEEQVEIVKSRIKATDEHIENLLIEVEKVQKEAETVLSK